MMSLRYVPAMCLLFALALVPTVIHSYVGVEERDDRRSAAIDSSLSGYTSVPSTRDAAWGARVLGSFDWLERRYIHGSDEVVLTVARSYDLKQLYHHPELVLAYGTSFTKHEVRRFASQPQIPVNVLSQAAEGGSLGLYVLHYEGEFVESPLLFQFRTAAELLLRGRKPMTLFFLRDTRVPPDPDVETLPATRLLFQAIDQFVQSAPAP